MGNNKKKKGPKKPQAVTEPAAEIQKVEEPQKIEPVAIPEPQIEIPVSSPKTVWKNERTNRK